MKKIDLAAKKAAFADMKGQFDFIFDATMNDRVVINDLLAKGNDIDFDFD